MYLKTVIKIFTLKFKWHDKNSRIYKILDQFTFQIELKGRYWFKSFKMAIHGVPDTDYSIIKRPLTTSRLEKWNVQHLWTSRGTSAYFSSLNELGEKVLQHEGLREVRHLKAMIALIKYNWVATGSHLSSLKTCVMWSYLRVLSQFEQQSSVKTVWKTSSFQ